MSLAQEDAAKIVRIRSVEESDRTFFSASLLVDIGRLLSPQGDQAAAWIHLFAITVMITIAAPRAALAAWRWRGVKRGQRDVGLRLDPTMAPSSKLPCAR